MGRPRQTIYAELARNTGKRGYRPRKAQHLTDSRQISKARPRKFTGKTRAYIESKIRQDHSPQQIAGAMKNDPQWADQAVSHETIYLHVYADKTAGDELYTHLRQRRKKRKPKRDSPDKRGRILDRVGIAERPLQSKPASESGIGKQI